MRLTLPFALAASLSAALLVAGSPSARADDPKTPATAAASAASAAPFRCTVKYVGGGSVSGVVRAAGIWEKSDGKGNWIAAKRDDPGAGVRVWYANGLDGAIFVSAVRVSEVGNDGPFTAADAKAIEKSREDQKAASDAARKRAAEERSKREADAKVAEENSAKAQAEAKAKADEAARKAQEANVPDAATQKKYDEILARFPPEKWTLDTPEKLKHRALILHIPANEEERAFIASFSTWKAAYTQWLSTQERGAGKPADGGAKKPSK